MPPRYSKDARTEKSLRHSVRDGVAYSIMTGAGESYFSAYAVFLKATTGQIGVLAAFPSLLGSLAELLSAWLGQRTGRRKHIILAGVLLQTATWLPLIWLPHLFPAQAVPILIACVVIYHAGLHLSAPMWNSLMGDLVPERKRGRYFARRSRLMSVSSFAALIAAGLALQWFEANAETRLGFTVIFAIAAAARCYSLHQLTRMHEPGHARSPLLLPPLAQLLPRLRRSHFARFSIFFALVNFAVAIASPFFTLYILRDLGFSYIELMANTATAVAVQFLTLSMWGRVADAYGNRLVLTCTAVAVPLMPALWLLSADFWFLLAVQAFSGLTWSGFSLAAGNFFYDLVPSGKRAVYSALHSVLCSSGVFAGAIAGGLLALHVPERILLAGHALELASPLWGLFFVSAVARLAVVALFVPRLREGRTVRRPTLSGLLLRVLPSQRLSARLIDSPLLRRRRIGRGKSLPSQT
jgi:MFS family permease